MKVAFAGLQRQPGDAQLREAVAKLMQKPEIAESYRAFLESQSKPAKPSPP